MTTSLPSSAVFLVVFGFLVIFPSKIILFFHCTSFGRQAEFVERYFHSGSRVLVIGRVQNNNYTTKEGSKVYGFSIITEEVEFAQKKSAEKPANKDSDFSSVPDEEQPVDDR